MLQQRQLAFLFDILEVSARKPSELMPNTVVVKTVPVGHPTECQILRCFAVLGTLRADRLAAADEIVPAIDVELMQRLLG